MEEFLRSPEDVEFATRGIVSTLADIMESSSTTAEMLSALRKAKEEWREQQDLSA